MPTYNRGRSQESHGVAESKLRAKSKAAHRAMVPQALLTPDVVRERLKAGMCPYCDRGPFKVVVGHTSRTHGIGPREIRDAAGVFYSESFTDPATHSLMSHNSSSRDMSRMRAARRSGRTHRVSDAARAANIAKLRKAQPEARAAAAAKAKADFEDRLSELAPLIQAAIDRGETLREIATSVGVHPRTLGQYARRLGYSDGRSLPGATKNVDTSRMRAASAEARRRETHRVISTWRSTDGTWAALEDFASTERRSTKSLRAFLANHGEAVPDGRTETTNRSPRPRRSGCGVSGCPREHVARGLCRYHWNKDRIARGAFSPCSEPGCTGPVVARGVCGKHYAAARKSGSTGARS